MKSAFPRGFTLVELLVVIAIIGVLVGAMVPAIQASREVARRTMCTQHVGQLLLAVQSYENAFESLPAGVTNPDGPIRSEASGYHQGWLVQMLPYLDDGSIYRAVDFSKGVYDPANARVRLLSPDVFLCPSSPESKAGASDYAGGHHDLESPIADDNHGVMFLNSHVRREDITDGASHTLFVGEKLTEPDDLGWMSGTRATLRNTGTRLNDRPSLSANTAVTYVGGFASPHVNGANIGFGDGSVKFVPETIDIEIWRQLGHRADSKLLDFNFPD
jgi:prepilin-type N-terminal cleavage/methylation domain-containing protein/prepilin-type processing-associated H-X9-DG protein